MNISDKAKKHIDSCRFCWMCRHICPIGNATGLERNTARARALSLSMVYRGAENLKDMADNLYECALCGACVKECVTGWDPVEFTVEAKTEASLTGVLPKYVVELMSNFDEKGNIYAKDVCDKAVFNEMKTDTLLFFGETVRYNNCTAINEVNELLKKAGETVTTLKNEISSGYSLYYLAGKIGETKEQMVKCAEQLNLFKKIIVYDPQDLKLFKREYKEFGIELKPELVSFNQYVLGLIESGKLKVKKSNNVYTAQDNFNYSRELEDSETIRKIIEKVGTSKDMLLFGKDTMFAGSLIMKQYIPEVMKKVALNRWENMKGMNLTTIITESPDEYVMLKDTKPEGYNVLSVEQLVLASL